MRSFTLQICALAALLSAALASPVPVEITPVAEYIDNTVSNVEASVGGVVDALGLKATKRAEITPLAEYLDDTVADIESELGGAVDALGLE